MMGLILRAYLQVYSEDKYINSCDEVTFHADQFIKVHELDNGGGDVFSEFTLLFAYKIIMKKIFKKLHWKFKA